MTARSARQDTPTCRARYQANSGADARFIPQRLGYPDEGRYDKSPVGTQAPAESRAARTEATTSPSSVKHSGSSVLLPVLVSDTWP